MALRPGQAKGPSVSKDNVGVGTITGSGTIGYIPYWTAAQALGDSTFRYDVVSGNIGLHTAPAAGTDLLIANASYANLGVVSDPVDKHATIFANALNGVGPFTSIGIRNYGNAYGGTINGVTLNSLAILSTAGKPSALAIIGINDTDTVKIPVYIGQKTTNFDNWIARFTNASMEIQGVVGIGTTPNPYIGLSVLASDTKASISISTLLNTNAASLSIAGDDGSFYNRSYGSIAAGTALGINNANANDITAQYYTLPTCLRIYGDNQEDNVKVPVYIGQRTLNFDAWLVKFDNSLAEFAATVQLNTTTASTFIYSNASRQIVSLANAAGYLQNDGAGGFSFTTPALAQHALDSTTAHSLGSLTTAYVPYVLTNKLVNSTISITGGVTSISGTVAFSSLTASTFVYLNASNQFVSLANAAGYLANNGAGVMSWSAVTVTGFIKDPGGLTDGQVLRFETGGNARNSPINADSTNGTIGVNNNANSSELINGRKDPANIVMWAISGNSYEAYHCHGGDSTGGLYNYRESYAGTRFTLSLANMMYFGTTSAKASSVVYGSVNSTDAVTVPIYIGQKSTTIDNWTFRLASDRVVTLKFTLNDNTAQTTLDLLRERTDAAFTYSDDMGRITCSLKDNTVDANVFRIQFGAVPAGNGGTFKFQVNTNISGAASWNPIFYYNGTKVYLSCNGLAEIFLMQAAHSKFQADTGGNYDIQLITAAGAYVDFAGPAYVSTSITATGYLPIKIKGVAYKMLVST